MAKSVLSLVLVLSLCLCGCGKEEPGVTFPTEQALPCTLGAGALSVGEAASLPAYENQAAFSYTLSQKADGIKLILFRLENGSWEDVAGGSWLDLPGGTSQGKLVLSFDALWEQCQVSSPDREEIFCSFGPQEDLTGFNRETRFLQARTDADWEALTPIALQAASHQDRIYVPDLDIFRHPEAYETQELEALYLLAVAFRPADSQSGQ